MPANNSGKSSTAKNQDYQALVRKVSDRVWELWQQDMRRGKERQGPARRSS